MQKLRYYAPTLNAQNCLVFPSQNVFVLTNLENVVPNTSAVSLQPECSTEISLILQIIHADKTEMEKLQAIKCHVDGKDYIGGQKIYPENTEASCICNDGFNNRTFENNPHCEPLDCNIEVYSINRLRDGCVPIYYKKVTGCPIDWVCRKSK